MSDKEYFKMTVPMLKEELKRRGLEQSVSSNDDQLAEIKDLQEASSKLTTSNEENNGKDNDVTTANKECTKEASDENMQPEVCHEKLEENVAGDEITEIIQSQEALQEEEDFIDGNDGIKQEPAANGKECEEPALTENCGPQLSEAQETVLQSNCGSDVPSNIFQEDLVEQKDETQSDLIPATRLEDRDDQVEIKNEPLDTTPVDEREAFDMTSEDDDLRISSLFGIEMKRERDAFQLKWHGKKFTVPFIGEIIKDLATEVSERSFTVRSVTLEDVQSSCFQEIIHCAVKFLLDFQENILEPPQPGFAKFVCKNNEDCIKFKESLRIYKDNFTIENISFDDQLAQQFFNRDASYYKGTIVDRLLYVGNLPCDVAECTVRDLFPEALRVIFPPLKDLDKSINSARYVYVEYPSAEDVIAVAEKCKELKFNEEKLFVIKALCVKKERFGLLTDTLRTILLDKVRKMRKIQKNPWNKSRQEMQEIEKTISLNMEKLSTDSKHRRNWNMELGALDESRLDQDDPEKIDSISERGRGQRTGSRGGSSRGSFDSRRGHMSGRYSGFNNYNSRGGWGGSFYGSSGYMNSSYNQNYGGYGSQETYFNKRKSGDNYGGDWKRGRHY